MAPTTRQSAEKEAAAEADPSAPQVQAAASSSASPDTMAAYQPNTFDALISLMTKQLEEQRKNDERREKERAQREKERAQREKERAQREKEREQEREQEREADKRERHDFHQQMLAAFAALSAEIRA
ncbi:MAG: hypothetical protein SEPTF4163_006551, partial [Sporothrix epigloea]